jgi:hypothetical protein
MYNRKEHDKKYKESHKEQIKKYNKEYRDKHKDEAREATRLWELNHPDIVKQRRKKWFQKTKNKEYMKNYHLIKNYNITLDDYNKLFLKQEGKCKICHQSFESLIVDHNHKTNKVRGLLCDNCNCGIGFLKENTDILLEAIEYLKGE